MGAGTALAAPTAPTSSRLSATGVTESHAADLTIDTPVLLVAGQTVTLSFGGGPGPYTVRVLPAGQVSGQALKEFPATNNTSLEWTVDLPANTPVTLSVTDDTGQTAYTIHG
ncbi:hypothetical protein ACFV98_30275 [Streptomyces violascens]|uniref:hypothetical protein n=1 Tax=Streptomyces violascens TaxID=67381 RepID=UPI003667A917